MQQEFKIPLSLAKKIYEGRPYASDEEFEKKIRPSVSSTDWHLIKNGTTARE